MEKFSRIKSRTPLKIKIHSYLMDHHIEGKPVLPGVEAMQILAASTQKYLPDINIRYMVHASFDKFLYLKPDEPKIELFNDIKVDEDGNIASKLISISKIGNITRPKAHVILLFPHFSIETEIKETSDSFLSVEKIQNISDIWFEIPTDKIYKELVPFGPAYRNITRLHICEKGAVASIKSGDKETAYKDSWEQERPLGSSFPLDAAFHAACVWGQRFSGVVGFPVGFQKRVIFKPTQPEKRYFCNVFPVEKISSKAFTVNILLYDLNHKLCEEVSGVQMRDVSGGRMTPPQWISV